MRVTASRLPIIQHCNAWTVWDDKPIPSNVWADEGTNIHAEIASAISGLVEVKYRQTLQALDWLSDNQLSECQMYPEYKFTGDITGIADLVLIYDGVVHVVDWKTGQQSPHTNHDWQLSWYALEALREFGGNLAVYSVVWLSEDSYYEEFKQVTVTREQIWERVKNITAPNPGAHCRYCPGRTQCKTLALAEGANLHSLSPQELARWVLSQQGRLEAARNMMFALAPIELNGAVLEKRSCTRETVCIEDNPALARAILGEDFDRVVEVSATKTSIQRAGAGKKLPALREAGLIKSKTTERIEWFKK